MRKNQFSGYRDLKREGKQLERRYQEWKRRMDCTANPSPAMRERFQKICDCIEAQRLRALDEQLRIEKKIAEIPDSLLRQIFTMRYLEGLPWQLIAQRVGGSNEDSLRIMHGRYLDALEREEARRS